MTNCDVVELNSASKPKQDVKNVSDESSVDVETAAVMLLSETSSVESGYKIVTSSGSPEESKLFPIFSSKISPSSTNFKSNASSRSESSSSSPTNGTLFKINNKPVRSSPRHILKRLQDRDGKEQMTLDFGQKLGQLTACDGCGMTYSEQEPSDIVLHTKFHKNIFNTLKFPGWKKERICQENPDGSRIIVVTGERAPLKKVQTVRNIVDAELGFASEHRRIVPGEQTFLYISGDQQVVGCCVAQIVTKGYRVISDGQTGDGQSATSKPWCCSTNAEPVKCGISRIWVLASERGQKIGSKLIDCVRYHFILGYPLKKADLAFSDPTPDGRSFATRYMGTSSFLVYRAFRSPSLEQ